MHHATLYDMSRWAESRAEFPLVKRAYFQGLAGEALGKRFGTAGSLIGSFGAGMIPGVAAVDSGIDAAKNFGEMGSAFGSGNWRQGLWAGAKGIGNLGLGALSILPGMGGINSFMTRSVAKFAPKMLGKGLGLAGAGLESAGLTGFGRAARWAGANSLQFGRRIGQGRGMVGGAISGMGKAQDYFGGKLWNRISPRIGQNYERWNGNSIPGHLFQHGTHPIRTGLATAGATMGASMLGNSLVDKVEGGPQNRTFGQMFDNMKSMRDTVPTGVPDPVNEQGGGNQSPGGLGQTMLGPVGSYLSNYLPGGNR